MDDESLGVEAAEVTLVMTDGRRSAQFVEAAHGSLASPLTDTELGNKCRELVRYGESGVAVEPLLDTIWALDRSPDASIVMELAAGRRS